MLIVNYFYVNLRPENRYSMRYFLIAIIIFISSSAVAQTRISDPNQIGWYHFIGTIGINKKFSIHTEGQWRRDNWIKSPQQNVLRAGLTYKINKQVSVQAAYTWALNYDYGDYTLSSNPQTFPEHRAYEQVLLAMPVGKAMITNRLRLEQRFIGRFLTPISTSPDQWVYVNRVRFMERMEVPVYKKLSAIAYDEIFIAFGKNVGENVFDQNRISLQLGYKISKTFKLEAGYINQTLQLGREIGGKNVFQYNNGVIAVINFYL